MSKGRPRKVKYDDERDNRRHNINIKTGTHARLNVLRGSESWDDFLLSAFPEA